MCWCFIHYWIEKCTVKQWNILTVWNNNSNNNNNNNTRNNRRWNSRASRCNSCCLFHAFGAKIPALAPVTRTTVLRIFPQSLLTFSRIVNQIRPLSFSSTYFWGSVCCLPNIQNYKICVTEAQTNHKRKNYKKKNETCRIIRPVKWSRTGGTDF